ncbi:hypothetical protein BpHYR1_004265 [Brachionus plicatilis]|uniref:Uncharacterized protein n=1 Tax=Brachionus plicatilis TaxID=10195 RepID=A0A3M7SVD8_BRAPC|nr:hypothetical protein BpHYR1_004265 [Brachionus plicatilis]
MENFDKLSWEMLEDDLTELELKEYIRVQIPKSVAYQTNRDYLCKLLNDNVREFVYVKKKGRPAKSNNGALSKN